MLPTIGSEGSAKKNDDASPGPKAQSLIKAIIEGFQGWVGDVGRVFGLWGGERDNNFL